MRDDVNDGQSLGRTHGGRQPEGMGPQIGHVAYEVGGLAIRSAMQMSHAACWASWADALNMRLPQVAEVLAELAQDTNQGCIGELRETAVRLDREGFVNRPGWIALKDGQRPEAVEMWVAPRLAVLRVFLFRIPLSGDLGLAQSCAADQAHIRSHSGPGSADVFLGPNGSGI